MRTVLQLEYQTINLENKMESRHEILGPPVSTSYTLEQKLALHGLSGTFARRYAKHPKTDAQCSNQRKKTRNRSKLAKESRKKNRKKK